MWIKIAASLLLLGIAASWLAGSLMVAGHHSPVEPARLPARDVKLQTSDNLSIAGTYIPGAHSHSPAVLLLHGVRRSRAATAANAEWLSSLGYATLTIDFRGHGQSDLATRSFGLHEAIEARAAFDWLKRHQQNAPVAVIGISLGGAASLIGDAGPIPADALILQAVYPDIRHAIRNRIASRLSTPLAYLLEPLLSFQAPLRFGAWPSRLSPLRALPKYARPVLIIGGEEDSATPPDETRLLLAAVKGHGELWLAPSGDHEAVCDLADAAYRQKVQTFLQRTLAPLTMGAS